MDCLFGFLLLALMLFIYNKYLRIKREAMSQNDVMNTTLNKQRVLQNTASLKMIRDQLDKNIKDFKKIGGGVGVNTETNERNKQLLASHVNKTKEDVETEQKELDKLPDIN